jgi:hypothetical protein
MQHFFSFEDREDKSSSKMFINIKEKNKGDVFQKNSKGKNNDHSTVKMRAKFE